MRRVSSLTCRCDPWDYPECPRCETNVLVDRSRSQNARWVCYGCDRHYTADQMEEE